MILNMKVINVEEDNMAKELLIYFLNEINTVSTRRFQFMKLTQI